VTKTPISNSILISREVIEVLKMNANTFYAQSTQ